MDRDDYRCILAIIAMFFIILTSPYTTPLILSFVAFLIYFWYLTIPVFIIGVILYRYYSNHYRLDRLAESFHTLGTQESYENLMGKGAFVDEKLSSEYKAWLIRDVSKKRPKTTQISTKTYILVIVIIASLAIFSILLFNLYSILFGFGAWY